MELHVIDVDGRPAAVVDDPVIPDGLGHPAAGEVHVDAQPGLDDLNVVRVGVGWRHITRCQDRNARSRAHASFRPDDDPASARKKDPRRVRARAAVDAPVHDHRLLAQALCVQGSDANRSALTQHTADSHTTGSYPARIDRTAYRDGHAPRGRRPGVIGYDAVSIGSGRGDGVTPARGDLNIATAPVLPVNAVSIGSGRGDGVTPARGGLNIATAQVPPVNAVRECTRRLDRAALRVDGQGARVGRASNHPENAVSSSLRCRNFRVVDADLDGSAAPSVMAVDAMGSTAAGRDGSSSLDIADAYDDCVGVSAMLAVDAMGSTAAGRDGAWFLRYASLGGPGAASDRNQDVPRACVTAMNSVRGVAGCPDGDAAGGDI